MTAGQLNETFFKQLTAEKVRTKFIKGFPIRERHKDQGVRNEALDRRVYAMSREKKSAVRRGRVTVKDHRLHPQRRK